jgi:hypothetical protein
MHTENHHAGTEQVSRENSLLHPDERILRLEEHTRMMEERYAEGFTNLEAMIDERFQVEAATQRTLRKLKKKTRALHADLQAQNQCLQSWIAQKEQSKETQANALRLDETNRLLQATKADLMQLQTAHDLLAQQYLNLETFKYC